MSSHTLIVKLESLTYRASVTLEGSVTIPLRFAKVFSYADSGKGKLATSPYYFQKSMVP